MSRARAPLYTDSFLLCEWLLGRLGDDDRALPRALCARALALHEAILLALDNRRRAHHLDMADEALIALRSQLRLAAATGCLGEGQVQHALVRADAIGRQLGGWRRALERG